MTRVVTPGPTPALFPEVCHNCVAPSRHVAAPEAAFTSRLVAGRPSMVSGTPSPTSRSVRPASHARNAAAPGSSVVLSVQVRAEEGVIDHAVIPLSYGSPG